MILVDTNVLLDVALKREPHFSASAELLARLAGGDEPGAVAWHALATAYYLISKGRGRAYARTFVLGISEYLSIPPTNDAALRYAASLPMKDFEDAMQVAAARACSARVIATRDLDDFQHSPIRAVAPSVLLAELV